MGSPIFLVRLSIAYRLGGEDGQKRYPQAGVQAAFRNRADAEDFIFIHYPAELTPLDSWGWNISADGRFYIIAFEEGDWEKEDGETDVEDELTGYDVNALITWLIEEGFDPPLPPAKQAGYYEWLDWKKTLQYWWGWARGRVTEEQKNALWEMLDPQPYRIVEVESDL